MRGCYMPTEQSQAEQREATGASRFARYLRDYDPRLKEGVTPEQFAEQAENLSDDLTQVALAAKGIFKTAEIARQFGSIAEHALSLSEVLDQSPFVREEMQPLV